MSKKQNEKKFGEDSLYVLRQTSQKSKLQNEMKNWGEGVFACGEYLTGGLPVGLLVIVGRLETGRSRRSVRVEA